MAKFISSDQKTVVTNYLVLGLKFGLLVLLMAINFTALAVALQCNKDKGFGTKFVAGIYAFFFGIIYLVVNYYSYRVLHLRQPCKFDGNNIFPI